MICDYGDGKEEMREQRVSYYWDLLRFMSHDHSMSAIVCSLETREEKIQQRTRVVQSAGVDSGVCAIPQQQEPVVPSHDPQRLLWGTGFGK